ncbi:MAG: RNA polymerase-associated protein RapA [Pseudomonadales bacterium]|nr:RNA polymerase-associated protein RapA [Pseudomonadales bacterium]
MSQFIPGQRWISNTEATLGLGIVVSSADRRVTISFPAASEERVYAMDNAPLNRITYKVGNTVHNADGDSFKVLDVLDHNGMLIYKVETATGEEDILPEIELDCFVHFNSPKDRLLSGQIDPIKYFHLRQDSLNYLRDYQKSGVVGLMGPRVQLLPHQLYIAHQVANRVAPRVLLADEVGLGKTIEAGLILHQQLQSGLANRVLILVPDSLLHQWLVEMLRRFNLAFSVLDEDICQELAHEQDNPFDTRQLVLCPLSFLVNDPERAAQALACDWDLLVVDEAHHLEWQADKPSAEYECVEALANKSRGCLLLTATPEQLGLESHFARLRLLDPDRYYDLSKFIEEEAQFKPVNELVHALLQARDDNSALPSALADYLKGAEIAEIEALFFHEESRAEAVEMALSALLDRHGTGRVLFRNTRAAVEGFPQRILHKHALAMDEDHRKEAPVDDWLHIEKLIGRNWLIEDARVDWLTDMLDDNPNEKFLLICHTADTAITLEEYLRSRRGVRSAVFHEHLSLIARDRAAAYFADSEDAAQILICSEIGSEGRNFQFAKHIIMFDLPVNPDLLEQRIGRLDRIGQKNDINIHVPFYTDTAQQVLLDWYHEGLNAFEQTCAIGHAIYEEFAEQISSCLLSMDKAAIDALNTATKKSADLMRAALHAGRDQLLEMNSCRPIEAEKIIDKLMKAENRKNLEDFIDRVCDQIGIDIEPHSANAVILRPNEHMRCGLLPGLKDEGVTVTYSRENALSREDMGFMSWEHPFAKSALEYVLSGDHGNTALGTVKLKPLKEGTLLLEALYTVDCIAPAELRLGRYLPATNIRVLVNLAGKDLSKVLTSDTLNPLVERVKMQQAQALVKQAAELIDQLMENADVVAQKQLPTLIDDALKVMNDGQHQEVLRLQALSEVNPNIKASEVDAIKQETDYLAAAISHADIKLDAIRVILSV